MRDTPRKGQNGRNGVRVRIPACHPTGHRMRRDRPQRRRYPWTTICRYSAWHMPRAIGAACGSVFTAAIYAAASANNSADPPPSTANLWPLRHAVLIVLNYIPIYFLISKSESGRRLRKLLRRIGLAIFRGFSFLFAARVSSLYLSQSAPSIGLASAFGVHRAYTLDHLIQSRDIHFTADLAPCYPAGRSPFARVLFVR